MQIITLFSIIVITSAAEDATPIPKSTRGESRDKRNLEYTLTYKQNPGSFRLERRIGNGQPMPNRANVPYGQARSIQTRVYRPRNTIPPYAVQMEPLVQYSQRDPLYNEGPRLPILQDANDLTAKNEELIDDNLIAKRRIFSPPPPSPHFHHHHPPPPPHYEAPAPHYEAPEPIIEIIIKESNESLPAPPPPPPQPPRKKEPVQVFYVKYRKDPYGGKDSVIYDAPIPAVTPASNIHDEREVHHQEHEHHEHHEHQEPDSYANAPPPPSTTLRTVIHPDSEVYHTDSNVHVTFGTEDKYHHEKSGKDTSEKHEESAPQPQLAFPNPTNPQHNFPNPNPTSNPIVFPQTQATKRQPTPQTSFTPQFQTQFPPNQGLAPNFNNPFLQNFNRPFGNSQPNQYSTIQLGPQFNRPAGAFHPGPQPLPQPQFLQRPQLGFPPNFQRPQQNQFTKPPFQQGLPNVNQRQPFNPIIPQQSFNSGPSTQSFPSQFNFNKQPPINNQVQNVYQTIRLQEQANRPQIYQTIKLNDPRPVSNHLEQTTQPIYQNQFENRPQFQDLRATSFNNYQPTPNFNQQSFQYFDQNNNINKEPINFNNKLPLQPPFAQSNANFNEKPHHNQQQQQQQQAQQKQTQQQQQQQTQHQHQQQQQSQHQQPHHHQQTQHLQQSHLQQSQHQQQQNDFKYSGNIPAGGELIQSIPKFEQHLSIEVPIVQQSQNLPLLSPTPNNNFNGQESRAPNHNYDETPPKIPSISHHTLKLSQQDIVNQQKQQLQEQQKQIEQLQKLQQQQIQQQQIEEQPQQYSNQYQQQSIQYQQPQKTYQQEKQQQHQQSNQYQQPQKQQQQSIEYQQPQKTQQYLRESVQNSLYQSQQRSPAYSTEAPPKFSYVQQQEDNSISVSSTTERPNSTPKSQEKKVSTTAKPLNINLPDEVSYIIF